MALEVVRVCPLGMPGCTYIKDEKMYRCEWLTKLAGVNPNTGAAMDEEGCAIVWMPILAIESAQAARSTSAAVESFRNEVVKASDATRMMFGPAPDLAMIEAARPERAIEGVPTGLALDQISQDEHSQ